MELEDSNNNPNSNKKSNGKSSHGKSKRKGKQTRLKMRALTTPTIPSLQYVSEQMDDEEENNVENDSVLKEENDGMEEEKNPFSKENYPILAQLESDDPLDREEACRSLSIIIQEPDGLQVFLEQDGIKKMIQHYCDFEIQVKIAAAGCLRNISVVADHLCDEIVRKDCITVIVSIIQQAYSKFTQNGINLDKEEIINLHSLLIQTISLLSNLCEYTENATKIFARSKCVNELLFFLNQELMPDELILVTAQFLNIITDESSDCISQLRNIHTIKTLQSIVNDININIYIRMLCASIGYNLSDKSTQLEAVKTLAPCLIATIQIDLLQGLSQLNLAPQQPSQTPVDISEKDYQTKIKMWNHALQAQKLGLEVLTNICSQDDESINEESEDFEIILPKELKFFLIHSNLFNLVLNKCQILPDIVQVISKLYPSIGVEKLVTIQCRAFNCLGNMLLIFQPQEIKETLGKIWDFLCQSCSVSKNFSLELTESITHVMFFLLKKYQKNLPFELNAEQGKMIAQFSRTDNEYVRCNVVGLLGIFGQQSIFSSYLEDVGTVMITNLLDPSLEVVCETLNSIFDVFAEPPVNEVVNKLGMIQHLQKCLNRLKHLQEVKDPEVEAAEINLKEFLKYKSNQFR